MSLRVITLAGDLEREAATAASLSTLPGVDLVLRCVERAEALASIRGGSIEAILSVGAARWFDFQCIEEAGRAEIHLVGLAADPIEVELLEVAGFSVLPAEVDLHRLPELIRAAEGPPAPVEPATEDGRIVAVWGPKGAPGRTTLSFELAEALALSEPSTLLVDADLYGGDLLQVAGIVEELPGIVPIARRAAKGELRDPSWTSSLRRIHPAGPALVPGLLRAELWDEVSLFGFERLMAAVRSSFAYSVWDVGFCLEEAGATETGGRNRAARAAVMGADRVVAVFRADPVGIKTFMWAWTAIKDLIEEDKLVVVANRVRVDEVDEVKTLIRTHLGRTPIGCLPDRPDLLAAATWEGRSVVHGTAGSPVSEEVLKIAAALGARVRARGFLSRLVGRG